MTLRNLLIPFGYKPKVKVENPYGDMLARSLAACIDVMLMFFIFYNLFYWVDKHYFPEIGSDFVERFNTAPTIDVRAELVTRWILRAFVQFFFLGMAVVGCQWATGTTPGKWLVGLKIVRAKTHEPVARWRFLVRYLAYIVACGPLMLGMFWINFNKERRGWHDYIAGTVVLNLRPNSWYYDHAKRGFLYLKGKLFGLAAEKQPVGEPAAEQRHEDGGKPVD